MKSCECCGEPTQDKLLTNSGEEIICENCDEQFEYCQICEVSYYTGNSTEETCRHLHWSDELGCWCGCGSAECPTDDNKPSFFRLLDRIGYDAAQILKHALKIHSYKHQFTMYGVDAYWTNEKGETSNYEDMICHEISGWERDALEVGVKWLVSLWSDKDDSQLKRTPVFDLMTAQWIEEWEARYSQTLFKKYPNTNKKKVQIMSSGIFLGISYFGKAKYVNLDKILQMFLESKILKESSNYRIVISDKSANTKQQLRLLPYSKHIKAWHDGKEIATDQCRKILFNIQ